MSINIGGGELKELNQGYWSWELVAQGNAINSMIESGMRG